jgi:hypothetical protein
LDGKGACAAAADANANVETIARTQTIQPRRIALISKPWRFIRDKCRRQPCSSIVIVPLLMTYAGFSGSGNEITASEGLDGGSRSIRAGRNKSAATCHHRNPTSAFRKRAVILRLTIDSCAHAMIASGSENAMEDGKIELYRSKLMLSFKFEGSI